MEVVFCTRDGKAKYRVTAYGTVDIAGDDFDRYLGTILPFTVEREFGDFGVFVEHLPVGIMRATKTNAKFYEFEVVSGTGRYGQLRVLALSSEKGCLAADAPG